MDFGLSYIRAGQSSDKFLISKELEKKAANNITKDVIGSGFLFAQETIIPRDKTNNIFNKYFNIKLLLNYLRIWSISYTSIMGLF